VGILEIGHEDDVGLGGADDASNLVAVLDGVLNGAVFQAKLDAFDFARDSTAEDERGRGGFFGARAGIAEGSGFSVGHVEECDGISLRGEPGDGSAHSEFLIVGVRADDEDVGHVGE